MVLRRQERSSVGGSLAGGVRSSPWRWRSPSECRLAELAEGTERILRLAGAGTIFEGGGCRNHEHCLCSEIESARPRDRTDPALLFASSIPSGAGDFVPSAVVELEHHNGVMLRRRTGKNRVGRSWVRAASGVPNREPVRCRTIPQFPGQVSRAGSDTPATSGTRRIFHGRERVFGANSRCRASPEKFPYKDRRNATGDQVKTHPAC
jgi:hypothetical protein